MEKKLTDGQLRREEGQTMVEYSIVAALIAVVAMVAVQALGVGITGVFNDIVQSITSV
ncbi:MAG: Flp family type IVb pilin [Dehalococcoidia bacterium]|jgi:Flp pilus assembly pilin Flp|nr:Flp family type IVb pilin [Dehalococcoidia bacterium]